MIFHLVDMVILNSYQVFIMESGQEPQLTDLRLNLSWEILEERNIARDSPGGRIYQL
jgi:hypothetical protein